MLKEIKDFEHYYVDEQGNVYSDKLGDLYKLKPWEDSKKRYYIITLCKDGRKYKRLVHRLVAETFLPNPNNYPVVNHIDFNVKNNCVENLEWCTQLHNTHHALTRYSPIRNYCECELYYQSAYVNKFQSVLAAARYASEHFSASMSGLIRNYKSKGATIVKL